MESVYLETSKILKAIADPKRLKIVDMLSCGELCACKILEAFHITQPTLSHDMKVLLAAGVVQDRREGKNIYYSLRKDRLASFETILHMLLSEKRIAYATNAVLNVTNNFRCMPWYASVFIGLIHRKNLY